MKKKVILLGIIPVLLISYFIIDQILFTGIRPENVNENGIQGEFYARQETKNATTIILLGGGNWAGYWGVELANKGYAALSLPYYRHEGLPPLMEEIPLEYFEKAIDWLKNKSAVNPEKIIVMGTSRNGELALVLASILNKDLHGVIAYSPSAVSWSNTVLPYNSDEIKPSWTYHGKAIPYISMEKISPPEGSTINTFEYWQAGLNDSLQLANAMIPIEQINGPILLFSGKDDQLWPSAAMADLMEQKLEKSQFTFDYQNVQYEQAGHMISGNPEQLSTVRTGQLTIDGKSYSFAFGGTPEGDQSAQKDAKKHVFEFLSTI